MRPEEIRDEPGEAAGVKYEAAHCKQYAVCVVAAVHAPALHVSERHSLSALHGAASALRAVHEVTPIWKSGLGQ